MRGATVEPLPGDHKYLRYGWRGGVWLTVPRCLGEVRYLVRGSVVAATGEPRTFVCDEPREGESWIAMPHDEAVRIILQHAELLGPYIRTWGSEFNPQEESGIGQEG